MLPKLLFVIALLPLAFEAAMIAVRVRADGEIRRDPDMGKGA